MNTGMSAAASEALTTPPVNGAPVPTPPKTPLRMPRVVDQTPRSRSREHEVQRLIRDLAALADTHRPQVA